VKRSFSVQGGAFITGTGGTVSLWCSAQGLTEFVESSQLFALQVGGFS
jgi:hypothetical protein